MTKSAKHGTAKAAAGQSGTESAQGSETAPDTVSPAEGSARSGGTPAATASPATGAGQAPDLDEVKRKFRAALDRKHDIHKAGQGKGGQGAGKVNGAHGPAASRRSFRRKSGG